MQNLQGIDNFFHGFQSRPLDPKDFYMEATGTPRQSVGFPGARFQLALYMQNVSERTYTCIHILCNCLTRNVRGPSYLSLTRSISWLLMPWLLTSPGPQQPWYWLYRICRSFTYSRKCFKYLCQIMWRNDIKCKYIFMFPQKNLARKGLTLTWHRQLKFLLM